MQEDTVKDVMDKKEVNEDNNIGDYLKDAVHFKLLKPIFKNESDERSFDAVVANIEEEILSCFNVILENKCVNDNLFDVVDNFNSLPCKDRASITKKANKVNLSIAKSNDKLTFSELVKTVIISLLFARSFKKPACFSRSHDLFSGNGIYALRKIDYDTFTLIIDFLWLQGYIEFYKGFNNPKSGYSFLSRMYLSPKGEELFCDINMPDRYIDKDPKKLVVLTDRKKVKRYDKDKKRWYNKKIVFEVPIRKASHKMIALKHSRNVKKINVKLKALTIKVEANNIILNGMYLIDFLYQSHYISNIYDLKLTFSIELIDSECSHKDISNKLKSIDYLDKLIHLNQVELVNINYNQLTLADAHVRTCGSTRLLGISDHYRPNINDIKQDFIVNILKDKEWILHIRKIEFIIEQKEMKRVFSRNSFNKHGRFYDAIWCNLPKILRKNIYVNNSTRALVPLDFKALHPRLAYMLTENQCPNDPYIINGYGETYREYFKKVCLISLNAESDDSTRHAIVDKFEKSHSLPNITEDEAHMYLDAFKSEHEAISQFITNDFGIDAMKIDSDIIEDCMIKLMVKKGIVVLQVFDELLCPTDKVEEVKAQMVKSYRKIVKREFNKRNKPLKANEYADDYFDPIIEVG